MENKIRIFKDLEAWKQGHQLVLMVYSTTRTFPKDELFGLVSQMRRCAVSITSNVAEGFSRQSFKEKAQFYSIAQGSLTELQNQLLVSKDIGYIGEGEFRQLDERTVVVHKILNDLIKSSKRSSA